MVGTSLSILRTEVDSVHPAGFAHRTTQDVIWASDLYTVCCVENDLTRIGRETIAFPLGLR